MISRKFVFLAAVIFLSSGPVIGRAQDTATTPGSQADSLGAAARKARAQKKESSKPARVFTNEDLGSLKGTISVVGGESAPASGTDKAEKTEDKKTPADDSKKEGPKDEGYWRARFAEARKKLADDTKELDILQREFNLKQEQFYQDPNAALKQQHDRDDLNKTQSQIDDQKQTVEKDKQALSDLEDELRRSGGDPGWANEPSGAGPSGSGSSNSGAQAPL